MLRAKVPVGMWLLVLNEMIDLIKSIVWALSRGEKDNYLPQSWRNVC